MLMRKTHVASDGPEGLSCVRESGEAGQYFELPGCRECMCQGRVTASGIFIKGKGMCHCLAEVLHDVMFKTEGPMLNAGCQCDYRIHSCHPEQSGNRDCN